MPLYFVAQFHDITEELVATHELSEKARRDPLTGLYNREWDPRNPIGVGRSRARWRTRRCDVL